MWHRGLLKRGWILPVLIAGLIAAHVFFLYRVSFHVGATIVLALVLLVILKTCWIYWNHLRGS